MRSSYRLLFLLAASALVALAACSDDSTAPATSQSTTGLLEGEIGDADFTITLAATGNNQRQFEGPFVLRGSNLHYVDSLSALVVDLELTNEGDVAHAEPVGLTFVRLLPAGVTVQNPDNGMNGEGAAIEFAFANDDGEWTPGETSLPKTVQFGVAPETAVAFAAHLDLGEAIDGGTIAGRVWNDANEDGVIDDDEDGIEGVLITLSNIGEVDSMATDTLMTAHTDQDGAYSFGGLDAGVYLVAKEVDSMMVATTPTEITVLLVETSGDVSDFLDANFGCALTDDPGPGPDPFPMGAFLEVNGDYRTDPDRVVAQGLSLSRCKDDDDDDDDEDDARFDVAHGGGGHGDHEKDCSKGKLRGPVTDIDEAGFTFAVMGTWVTADESTFPEDLEVGDRVDVRVHHGDEDDLVVETVKKWHNSHFEQVHGRIDDVEIGDGEIRLRVLNTTVVVSRVHHNTP